MARLVLLLAAISLVQGLRVKSKEVEKKDGIHVLSDLNIKTFLKQHKYVFVMFMAPWCVFCKSLKPIWSKIANLPELIENDIVMAEMDCTLNEETADLYSINGYPTLKFFIEGEPVNHHGSRTLPELKAYIKSMTSPEATTLSDPKKAKHMERRTPSFLLLRPSSDSAQLKIFSEASVYYKHGFYHSSDASIRQQYGVSKTFALVVLRNFDGGVKTLQRDSQFSKKEIREFVDSNSVPAIKDFKDGGEKLLHKGKRLMIQIVRGGPTAASAAYRDVAIQRHTDMLFFVLNVKKNQGISFANNLNIEPDAYVGRIFGLKQTKEGVWRYLYKEDGNDSLNQFVDLFRSGAAQPFYKSQVAPEKQNGPVRTVVSSNFDQLVMDSPENVMVEFYQNNCEPCKEVSKTFRQLATEGLKSQDISFYRLNIALNEYPHVEAKQLPIVLLYKAGHKKSPYTINFKRRLNQIVADVGRRLRESEEEVLESSL